ncbi:effector-binding domain-containing protein [Methanomicrobium sp. W14]|uniref:MerR family transcriptional regulator n=1 Tax=Methanomicrobium sp. W14 TaxID=2817839 RepID=UPI001AEB9EFA|nr:GyrI-like domain-containing protein [Methanomicrobium sp. W14]MBP2132504.1 effector-binding domain-containing protein [Methanomicrobium sp. W14]
MQVSKITIGSFSHLTYLSQKALRLYDKKGILVPGFKDMFTGYRYYTTEQIEEALKIKVLAGLGFSLSEISVIMSAIENGDEKYVSALISKRRIATMAEIDRLEKIKILLTEKKGFTELFRMNVSEPVVKEVPALRVLSARRTGTYEEVCSDIADSLMEIVSSPENQKNAVKVTGPCISLCYDEEYRETDADIEMAVPVSGQVISDNPSFSVRTLPSCKVISVIYKGPYEHEGFSVAFGNVFRYASENGLETTGPDRQIYLNNPDENDPKDYLTEIQIPLK